MQKLSPIRPLAIQADPELVYTIEDEIDILGRLVKVIADVTQQPGNYKIKFDATGLKSGIYFYTVSADQFSSTKKMVLMR